MKSYPFTAIGVAVLIVCCMIGCSVIFSSSLSGIVVDKDDYEKAAVDPGINDVEVYLYLEESDRNDDYTAWNGNNDTLPEDADETRYHLHTTTNMEPTSGTNGYFSFDNVIWNNFFPTYGSSGDVKEFYLNFYHPSYGMVKKNKIIVSDADTTIGPVILELSGDREIRYGGQLNGIVFVDSNANGVPDTGEGVTGVPIKLYVNRDPGLAVGDLSDNDYASYSVTDPDSGTNGVFSFQQVVWQDDINPQRYSAVTCYIATEEVTVPVLGTVSGFTECTMYANTANFVYVPLTP